MTNPSDDTRRLLTDPSQIGERMEKAAGYLKKEGRCERLSSGNGFP